MAHKAPGAYTNARHKIGEIDTIYELVVRKYIMILELCSYLISVIQSKYITRNFNFDTEGMKPLHVIEVLSIFI